MKQITATVRNSCLAQVRDATANCTAVNPEWLGLPSQAEVEELGGEWVPVMLGHRAGQSAIVTLRRVESAPVEVILENYREAAKVAIAAYPELVVYFADVETAQ